MLRNFPIELIAFPNLLSDECDCLIRGKNPHDVSELVTITKDPARLSL